MAGSQSGALTYKREARDEAMDSNHRPDTAPDAVLNGIGEQRRTATAAVVKFYDAIREAKNCGYSYSELDGSTGLSRGTIQNIVAGKNPRFTV